MIVILIPTFIPTLILFSSSPPPLPRCLPLSSSPPLLFSLSPPLHPFPPHSSFQTFKTSFPSSYNGFLYLLDGKVSAGSSSLSASSGEVLFFPPSSSSSSSPTLSLDEFSVRADSPKVQFVLFAGEPIREPVFARGSSPILLLLPPRSFPSPSSPLTCSLSLPRLPPFFPSSSSSPQLILILIFSSVLCVLLSPPSSSLHPPPLPGPFVMDSQERLYEAFRDYQANNFIH